jgi:hypothetical protein
MESCIGCGAQAEKHPVVGIGRADLAANVGELVEHPVCKQCHENPAHRTTPLKVAYHPRANSSLALATARILDEKSKRGEDLDLRT